MDRLAEKVARAWPPERVVFPIRDVEIRVSDATHPFFLAERDAIARNWREESAANPALYDGEMLLQSAVDISDAGVFATAHLVSFSTFLLWRKLRPRALGLHLFGLPLLVSSDGAVVAIRMGRHTANPGKVYCAAGSLDAHDIKDGFCDIEANMAREVGEETGLDLSSALAEPMLHALHVDSVVTVLRVYRFAQTADEMLDAIADHMKTETEPEIDGAVAIRDSDPARHAYAAFMPPVLRWFFQRGQA